MHLTALDDAAWESPWRDIRVGEKVALSGTLLVTALLVPPWPGCAAIAACCVALTCGWARIPARTLALAVTPPFVFIAIGGATVAVVLGGEPTDSAWVAGPLWVDDSSIARGLSAAAHGVAGTLALMLLATTTPMSDLLAWFDRLSAPAPLVEVAALIYRLVFVLLASALAIHRAQVARCGDAPGPGRSGRRLRMASDAMGSVLVRAWSRSTRLQAGLEGRGYTDRLPVLSHERPASGVFIATGVLVVAGVWALVLAERLLGGLG